MTLKINPNAQQANYNLQQTAEASGASSSAAAEQEEDVSTEGMIFSLPHDVFLDNILPYFTDVSDLVSLRKTCRFFNQAVGSYVALKFVSPDALPILEKYGFEQLNDSRNRLIIQKACEACYVEGVWEGPHGETLQTVGFLSARMQIVEDRNLIRIFLRYLNTGVMGQRITIKQGCYKPMMKLLNARPELKQACCLNQITDVSKTAKKIRKFLHDEKIVGTHELNLQPLDLERVHAQHPDTCDRYISLIPPEIGHFKVASIDAENNRLMLLSKNISETLDDRPIWARTRRDRRPDTYLNVRGNQLGPIPQETHTLRHLQSLGNGYSNSVPILNLEQNDQEPAVLISFV